ncbi:Metal-nicotianamine transporter YSL2-like protein, partial [Drosera capensis]
IMIIDYKLSYPTGMATAVLINGFHTRGDKRAKFYFDFSMTYVGTGMMCSHLVNLSLLVGAVISWGLMWPLIGMMKGEWFPQNLSEESMKSLNGYKVFLSISLIFGDGLFNFLKVLWFTMASLHRRMKQKNSETAKTLRKKKKKELSIDSMSKKKAIFLAETGDQKITADSLKANELFVREGILMWIAASGYILFSMISTIAIPIIFPQVKWYYVIVAYILTPAMAFCNAYGAGLTDTNMSYNCGKVALFTLAALAEKNNGVVAALAGCGLIKSVVSVSCMRPDT